MLLLEHIFGLSFFLLALVSTASYHDQMKQWRLPLFYDRLKPMQERWGVFLGAALHFLAYVLTPIGFGLMFVLGLVFHS
jgi:hypothetical protein